MKHIHKLRRHIYPKTKTAIYFCTLPDCHHKMETHLTIGKVTLCNICDEPFVMNENTIKLKLPHCNNCGKRAVIGDDGKRTYVRKIANRVLSSSAQDVADNLQNRLDAVLNAPDEDI